MLPNRFPDSGAAPEYNTVDAALWFIETMRAYHVTTRDATLVHAIFEKLDEIIDWYARGTRFGIAVDSATDSCARASQGFN